MAKVKKLSINAFENVVKESFEDKIVSEWHGLEIVITPTISMKSMMELVAEVSDSCFLSDGTYIPEAMQAILNCGVIERFTNISLPAKLEAKYELVMRSGIVDFIMTKINTEQYSDIVAAIMNKIDYMCDTNITELKNSLSEMASSMSILHEKLNGLFDKVSVEDVKELLNVFDGDRKVENMVVDAYLERQKESLSIDGDG